MGRSMLTVVILISAIFAGIVISVQREMYKLPGVMIDNFLNKECENLNDYALRAAVRLATEDIIMVSGTDTLTFFPPTPYQIGNCRIDKIFFQVLGYDSYEATTYVSGTLQGKTMTHTGQIAYNYPWYSQESPLFLYNDYTGQTHNTYKILPDQSEYAESGDPMFGRVCSIPGSNPNIIHYSSKALDKYIQGGGGTHKCVEFGSAQTNGRNNNFAWIQTPDPSAPNYQDLLNRLKQYNVFTISIYAMPVYKSGVNNFGTLIWFASNPNHSKSDQPGYPRPSAAIWYNNYNSSTKRVTMHYGVTINDATTNGTYMEVTQPNVQMYSSPNQGVWRMFTLVFNNGVLSAYFDTQLVGTATAAGGYTSIKPNDFGFTLGMRDIRADSPNPLNPTQWKHPGTDYMFYNGLMDQIAFWDRAFTPEEIDDHYNNYIDASVKLYIKD